jgi:hypothetical protein
MTPTIICNRIQCVHCKDIIISHHRHDYKHCSCGTVSVDGGRDYLLRGFNRKTDYIELSLYSDSPFEELRHHIYRGSRGVDGKSPLTWIALSSIDDNYLDNLIKYKQDLGQEDMWCSYYIQEKQFRLTNK